MNGTIRLQAIAISPLDGDEQTPVLNSIATNILLVCADGWSVRNSMRTNPAPSQRICDRR